MSLKTPNLDDRTFQDIVSEARKKIQIYCPRWTDYNLSDPGITLIELFAWMTEMTLYRLNQVPDKNYIKFMELMGIRLQPPRPAAVNVTFRLSAHQPGVVTIPAGTEVATVRTETQDAIIFSTTEDARILPPTIIRAMTTSDEAKYKNVMDELRNPYRETIIFPDMALPDNALYLGYQEDLKAHTLVITIHTTIEGIGVDPTNPPWAWEYWDRERAKWSLLWLETDTTGGFNTSGQIVLHIPLTCGRIEVDGTDACWVRCRASEPQPGQGRYSRSPILKTLRTESIGCTVQASQGSRVVQELLGQSDGSPGQQFQLQHLPVLRRKPGEVLEVETRESGEFEPWQEVESFMDSGPQDPHYTLDSVSGEVRFGPSIRESTGDERQYGKTPPTGRRIRFSKYRAGGGIIGNVGQGTITILKTSIPYIATVTNLEAARGGIDTETLENAKLRAPRVLKASPRAVTQEDYEKLVLDASDGAARVKCISGTGLIRNLPPGTVRVLVVPYLTGKSKYLTMEDLQLLPETREEIQSYLDQRRLLATRLEVTIPEYVYISVRIQVHAKAGFNYEQLAVNIEDTLCRFIHPLTGGSSGDGWPFGRNLSLSDIYNTVHSLNGIEYIQEVQVFPVRDGKLQESATVINIPAHALPCSFQHKVILV